MRNTFSVTLQTQPVIPASAFRIPAKLLALSDIRRQFRCVAKTLTGKPVIDEHFNWVFGEGHLVFIGDLFDRGTR